MSFDYSLPSNKDIHKLLNRNSTLNLNYRNRNIIKKKEQNKYFSFNQSIHATMASFNRLPLDIPRTTSTIQDIYLTNWISKGYSNSDEENKFYLKGLILLANYIRNPLDVGIENLIINKSIYMNVDKFHTLGCKIDKIYETVDGDIEILDYKSGKLVKHQDNFEIDTLSSTCIFLVQKFLHLRPDTISYYYLRYNKKFTRRLTFNDIQRVYTNIYKHFKLLNYTNNSKLNANP